jgi:hypothetical protein
MMKSALVSSSQPRSIAVGDFNNDRYIDIVVANTGTHTIGIFIAKGNGTFANQQTFSTGAQSTPYSIGVSDFNNDNHLDIAVANYGMNTIGIFLGNGNGTFMDQILFSLGSSRPLFLITGDFNNDSRTDIIVANNGTNNIGILLGYGDGSFQDQITYSTGYDSNPYSIAVGDFNHDNHLDIAIANYGTNNIGIFLGYSNGSFVSQQTYTTLPKSNPSSIAVGHFNNDNSLDIIVANSGTGNIGIFLGQDNGTFLTQTIYLIGVESYPQYITTGDFNNDNKLDVVIVDSKNDQVHILPGNGNGTFATITTYNMISRSSPYMAAVADLNNNNKSDIVVANYDINNVFILIDYSVKPSARQKNYYAGSSSLVAVSDFNDDHILDLVFNTDNVLGIRVGLSDGTFGNIATFSAAYGSVLQYVCIGDLNNDNRMDVISTDIGTSSIDIFLGYGDGTFATMLSYSTGNGSTPWWVALGDVNNDQRLDMVSANTGSGSVGVFLGSGNGTFSTMVSYSLIGSYTPYSVALGDINNDDYLDFVVNDGVNYIFVLLGNGDGTFIYKYSYYTGINSSPFSMTLADLNSDHHLDIIVVDRVVNSIGILLGDGNGTFMDQTNYSTGATSGPFFFIVADFNYDNISDIAVTNFGSDQIVIFYGYGNGSFELTRTYDTGFGSKPYGITAADLNNDKKLEIIVVLAGTGNIAVLTEYYAAEFANQTIYSTGSSPQPFSVTVGDLNNDNRSDIIVANSGTDNLGILLASSNGTFTMEMSYLIGTDSHPQYVITCDINSDNQSDIVSVNSKTDSISIIMGHRNGTFEKQMMYSTGNNSYPYAAASGDLNNDNRLDLIVANEGTDNIGVFYGFNYTSFHDQMTYSSIDALQPYGIVTSDFNDDSFIDIAAVFYTSSNLGILFGYGNGSFSNIMIYSTEGGSGPYAIAVGDFNNDSRSDIVVANYGSSNIGVFIGYGNGYFAGMMTYSTGKGSYPVAVTVGDLNNDSRLDVVVANYGAGSIGVLLGYGNGSFSVVNICSTGIGSTPRSVTVSDFDNDRLLDIAVANFGTGTVGVLLGKGDGTFRDQMTFSSSTYYRSWWITVGDFNNDHQLDIATANWNANNVGILLGYGNGTFDDMMTYSTGPGSLPIYISIDDFNDDNQLDIAAVNSQTKEIVVLFGFGDGSFLLGKGYSTGISSSPISLTIGDFDSDTRLDIAVTNSASNNIGVFLGHGNEPFAGVTTYSTGTSSKPHSVAIADFNNDNRLDIAVANYGTDNIGILLGLSNGIFYKMITYNTGTGSAPYSVAIADFNNDSQLDIVYSNSEMDNIGILLGFGYGTFAMGRTYSTGDRSRPYTVAIGDFDNNNISDIVVTNSGTSKIFILYGSGNGTFENGTSYAFGYGYHPYSIAVADLNQDNWMDIVIACYDANHVETLIKMC